MAQTLAQAVASFPATDPDWQVADALNTPDASTYGTKVIDVPTSSVSSLLMSSGSWAGIVIAASDTNQPAAVRGLCITARDSMTTAFSTFKMTDPAIAASVKALTDGLLQATMISQSTHDALLALSQAPASWGDINNAGQAVTARDVGIARGGVA